MPRLLFFLIFLLAGIAGAGAEEGLKTVFTDDLEIPWRLKQADSVLYDIDTGEVTARGEVVIEKKDMRFSSDSVHLNPVTDTAAADGNVLMTAGEDVFSGSRLEYNWETKTGSFSGGTLFLKENNYHIQADSIEKTGENTYAADQVRVTTCDGESPAWEIEGKALDITYGGYGKVKGALLRVRDLPVFYTPVFTFPVNLKRQSGLLTPEFEFFSERKGSAIAQPFYWAINDSSDATLYATYMTRRGLKLGAEYRYFLSEDGKGVVMFDFLDDQKVDDGSGTSSADYGYDDDQYLRPNSDRYWFRMKHDQSLGEAADIRIDLDVVSDQDYLYDFKDGYAGYRESRSVFLDVFNRVIDTYDDPVRKNRLNFNRRWAGYSLNAEAVWWDDVIARRLGDVDNTLQYLPVVSFDRYRQPLFKTPLYAAFETQTGYFFRSDGARGFRVDLYPRIYLPFRLGRVLSIEPSAGFRQTLWQIDRFDGPTEDRERTLHRELYDARLDLSSEIYNVYESAWGDIDAMKHAAKFQLAYEYTPTLGQEEYPYFDGLDRIGGENLLTLSMVNTVTGRIPQKDEYEYRQLARFELTQGFDIDKDRDGDPEPFTPLEGDLQLNLGRWCQIDADAAWSIYTGDFLSGNIAYGFSDGRGDRISLQHRYAKSLRESFRADLTINLSHNLWLYSDYERNIKTGRDIGSSLGLVYLAQCWAVEVQYEDEDENTSVRVGITLFGLGDVGGSSRYMQRLTSWED